MAYNIPGTDIIFDLNKTIGNIAKLGNTFSNLFDFANPFNLLGGLFGGDDDAKEKHRQSIRDNNDALRDQMNAFLSQANSTPIGQEFVFSQQSALNSFPTYFGSQFTGNFSLADILSGHAAGVINDRPGVDNQTAFNWWQQQLPNVSNRLLDISKNLEPFVYNKAKIQYESDYPNQSANLPFDNFIDITKSADSLKSNGQLLINAGFTGNQVADINGGAIDIGGKIYKTTEQQGLDNTESIEQLQTDLKTAQDELEALQTEFETLSANGQLTDEKLAQLQTDFDAKSQEVELLKQKEADRQAQIEADEAQEAANQQFIIDNNLSPEHFSLTPEEQERDLFISQSQQFIDLETAKADLLKQKQLSDALDADVNATQEQKDAQRGVLNTSLAAMIRAGLSLGVPIGQILSSDDVTGAVENQPEDVGLNFRPQRPDLEISPRLSPRLDNVAGLIGGGDGFTTKPFQMSRFTPAQIVDPGSPKFNQFEDRFNPDVKESGFPKPKSLLNTGNSRGLLGRFNT